MQRVLARMQSCSLRRQRPPPQRQCWGRKAHGYLQEMSGVHRQDQKCLYGNYRLQNSTIASQEGSLGPAMTQIWCLWVFKASFGSHRSSKAGWQRLRCWFRLFPVAPTSTQCQRLRRQRRLMSQHRASPQQALQRRRNPGHFSFTDCLSAFSKSIFK